MKNDNDSGIKLTKGSKYIVKSLMSKEQCLETEGIFKGYTVIGGDEGMCMLLSDKHDKLAGKIRVIPLGMLISIDIIDAKKEKKSKDKQDSSPIYYG
jgi:hypothetical protein